jgi:DHA2 family multidrug resistance protein-like MFS transporter
MSQESPLDIAVPGAIKASRREWIGLAVIALPCMLYSMDLTVMNLALPALSRALKPSNAELLWIVDVYGFLLAGSLITMGMLGDRVGRRRLLLIGAGAFEVASLLAAFSTSATMLIVMRGLLGIAGATLAPSTLSLIRNMFADARERTFAIGIWTTSFSVGAAIGPLAGGLLLQHFWWGSAFLIGVPVMLALLLLGPSLLPEFRAEHTARIDWISAALSALGVLPVIYGIKHAALGGSLLASALWVLAGLAVGVVFVRRQLGLAEPLFDFALFGVPRFGISVATNSLTMFVCFGSFLLIAQYLQQVLGLSPMVAGLCTIPSAFGFIAGSMLSAPLVKVLPAPRVVAGSLFVVGLGALLLSQTQVHSSAAFLIVASTVLAVGTSPAITLSTDLIVSTAPPERAGAASAVSETGAEFGGALGLALLGTVGAAVYRYRMQGALPPDSESSARDTLSDAIAAASRLPRLDAAALIEQARQSFTDGLHVAALLGALIAFASAALVLTRLTERSPSKIVLCDEPRPSAGAGER